VVEKLISGGMDPKTPAAMVERGTTAAQRSTVSTLAGLPEAVQEQGLRPPALFVIGPAVKHAHKLDWFRRQPLSGERLVVQASAAGLAMALEAAGAEVVAVPTPVTPAARIVIGASPLTGCVLRSPAEVDWLDEEREGPGWEEGTVAWCVGRGTAQRARERGWRSIRSSAEKLDSEAIAAWIAAQRRLA
jgi:hypothetical protein